MGPVSTSELEKMVLSRKLSDYDSVRPDQQGDWLKVAEVRKLFEQAASDSSSSSKDPVRPGPAEAAATSHAAAQALSSLAHPKFRAIEGAKSAPSVRRPQRRQAGVFTSFVERLSEWISQGLLLVGTLLKMRLVQGVLAVIVAGVLFWTLVLPRWPVSPPSVLAEFQAIQGEMQTLVSQEAGPEAWALLSNRLHASLGRFGPRLQRQARAFRPEVQELAWAARLLPPALEDAKAGSAGSAAGAKLSIHLENAERLIGRRQELAVVRQAPRISLGDVMFWGMIVVDVGIGVWVLLFLWRRFGPAASRST